MKKKYGFTLAEVLITLAIIGVVAALTISSVVVKVKDSKIQNSKKVFRTKILDVAGLMYARNDLVGTTSADFISKLGNYMKLTKTCTSDNLSECFPSSIFEEQEDGTTKEYLLNSLKTPKSIGQEYTSDNNVGGIMADGTRFILSFDPNCSITTYSVKVDSCMHMVVDLPISSNKNIVDEDIYLYHSSLNDEYTVSDLDDIGCGAYTDDGIHIVCSGHNGDADFYNALDGMSLKSEDMDSLPTWIECTCDGGCYKNDVLNTDATVTSCQKGWGVPPIT